MDSDLEWAQQVEEKYLLEEEQKEEKNWLYLTSTDTKHKFLKSEKLPSSSFFY